MYGLPDEPVPDFEMFPICASDLAYKGVQTPFALSEESAITEFVESVNVLFAYSLINASATYGPEGSVNENEPEREVGAQAAMALSILLPLLTKRNAFEGEMVPE